MEWPRRAGIVLLFALSALLILLPIAEAVVPRQIAISGLRTNTSGGPEKNFFHSNVNFTIFGSQSGGRMLDTRQINVSTNTNGYWFVNYSTSGFDTEVDLWLSINNTAPRLFLDDLKQLHKHIKPAWVKVSRTPYASPVYDINYLKYMPKIETPIPNLFFAGIAITYPKLRSQNTAFESGYETAQIVLGKITA